MFMCFLLLDLLITRPPIYHKNKSNSLETRLSKDISLELYGQTLLEKYKGLTMKVETKYLLTNWFSDYHFCFHFVLFSFLFADFNHC